MAKQIHLKKVLIMAAGTGGHVFPGLAIAKQLQAQGVEIVWLGSLQGKETQWVRAAGFAFEAISVTGLRGKKLTSLLFAPFKLLAALFQSYRIIRRINPDVVLGMGGFVTGPGGVAAWLLNKPLVIHEQNAIAGMTNRYLAKLAKKTLQGFPNSFPDSCPALTVGNPVRTAIAELPPPEARLSLKKPDWHLLVLGGSLGAQALNELLPKALQILPKAYWPKLTHQTGEKSFQLTTACYQAHGISLDQDIELVPFIAEMDKAYSEADMVLCRAGALTVAELCSVGLGAILVPYPYAVDDHQTKNADYLVQTNAAFCVQQKALTAEGLAAMLLSLAQSAEQRLEMAKAAYRLRQNNVIENIVQVLHEVIANP